MPTTKHFTFAGHNQLSLAARLDLPDTIPRCYAIFSHCFTCSKDILVAYRISKQLAQLGIATLRFDFSGLGESEGKFSDTNFSTNQLDLLAAADFLAREYESPQLLIGHSLGGTAALACAEQIDSVKAVVTIASPSQPVHVLHHFGNALNELSAGSNSSIVVAGKTYAFKPQFLEDIKQHDMKTKLAQLSKDALIFSVKNDALVDEGDAEEMQQWIAGESVVISLENTDHLISDKASINFIADHISDWFKIYLYS
jgi:putative redox protein